MNRIAHGAAITAALLTTSCATIDDDATTAPSRTTATLKVLELPGQDEECRNLLDVQFTIANGDVLGDGTRFRPTAEAMPHFDAEDYSRFLKQGIERHYRATFTEEERKELDDQMRTNSTLLLAFFLKDKTEALNDPNLSPLVKRKIQFDATIMDVLSAEYAAERDRKAKERIAALERQANSSRQAYLDSLARRSDTRFIAETKSFVTTNDRFRAHYVRQTTPETCYAASLLTVWKYYGWQGSYQDFIDKRIPHCSLTVGRRTTASFNEIISTIFHLRTGDDKPLFNWTGSGDDLRLLNKISYTQTLYAGTLQPSYSNFYVQRPTFRGVLNGLARQTQLVPNPAQRLMEDMQAIQQQAWTAMNTTITDDSGNPPNLFKQYGWHQTSNPSIEGHVAPLAHTGHIVVALLNGNALLAGLKTNSGGHTVLVTGAEYQPAFFVEGDSATLTPSTLIRRVRVLDPGPEVEAEYWVDDVDAFFAQLRFGIVVHQDR